MKKRFIIPGVSIIILLVAIFAQYNKKEVVLNEERYVAYFSPSTSQVGYGSKDTYLVEFDSDGKVKQYKEKAFPINALINTKENILFQSNVGLGKLNKAENSIEYMKTSINDSYCGYGIAGELKNNIYYFFSNQGYNEGVYSSNLTLSDLDNNSVHDIEGFINTSGNDENSIYILTDDENDKTSKIIQRISVNGIGEINVEIKTINLGYMFSAYGKMIITKDYIFLYINEENNSHSILKISKNKLEIEDTILIKNYEDYSMSENSSLISRESIFIIDNRIYCITDCGEIYSCNIDNNEVLKEDSLESYDMNSIGIAKGYYDELSKEYYLLYLNLQDEIYYLNSYNLDGKLIHSVKLDELKLKDNLSINCIVKE